MSIRAFACACAVVAALAGTASASPGAGSIASADGASLYEVAPGEGGTVVTKIRGSDRTALATRRLRGSFEVPAVAGVRGGLSRDGGTLVLGGHPAAHASRFALLDTRTLRVRRMVSLNGTYSFDALSPDASKLYLLRFLSADGEHYAVQRLDLTDSDPVPRTLVEKGEPGEAMIGQPVARTSSPDGGWVYTLYDRAGGAPFVHALSTVDEFTVCIDLDALEGRADSATLGLKLRPDGNVLEVTAAGKPAALVHMDSFEVTTPPAPPHKRVSSTAPGGESESQGSLWWLVAGGIALAGLAVAAIVSRALRVPA